jgi:signal transduction histidine kinase
MAYFADRSRTRDTGGSGLGLAICYQLVDALG